MPCFQIPHGFICDFAEYRNYICFEQATESCSRKIYEMEGDIMTEEYEPFGDKWEKEMMQLTKPMLIDLLRKAYIDLKKVSNGDKFVEHIRDHLEDGESVICTICGKTVAEIAKERDQ